MRERDPPTSELDQGPELTAEQPGRYQLKELIAEGGQSLVHRAWDAHLGRDVAFKQPIVTGAGSARSVDRFLREARITARLEHPNIVPVYEIGRRADGTLYCTQKLVRGPDGLGPARTLAEALASATSLRERLELLPHFASLCYAVAYAHEQGVVHRDVKPANVLIGGLGETVLADWGLAVSPDRPTAGEVRTAGGVALGTPVYRSPEQSAGQAVDERTDVWSLGIVLYELLAGRPPISTLAPGHDDDADPPSALLEQPDAPKELAAIAGNALKRPLKQRYRSAKAMASDVAAFLSGTRVAVYDYSAFELARLFFTRHKTVAAAVTVAVVLSAISSFVFWLQNVQKTAETVEKRANLAARLVKDAREAELALEWDRAAAFYALARMESDSPQARWGAILAANRSVPDIVRKQLPGGVMSIAWSADGAQLAVACTDGAVRLFDRDGNETASLRDHAGTVAAVAFAPDGKALVSAGHDRRAVLWDLTSATPTPSLLLTGVDLLNAVAYAPDGATVAIAGENGRIDLVDSRTTRVVRSLSLAAEKPPPAYAIAFAEGGATIAGGYWDNRLRIWDVRTGRLRHDIDASPGSKPPSASVLGLAVSTDGKTVATSARDRAVRVWRVADGGAETRLDGHTGKVYGVTFSPTSPRVLASGGADGAIRLWDVANGQPLVGESFGMRDDVLALRFSPDGSRLAWGGDAGRLWIRKAPVDLALPALGSDRVYALDHSLDGARFAYSEKGAFVVVDLQGGAPPKRIATSNLLQTVGAFTPDGKSIAVHCDVIEVCLVDLESGAEIRRFEGQGRNLTAIAFSPDGAKIALAGTDSNVVRIRDVKTGVELGVLDGHTNTVFTVAWSKDGRTLASGSYDTTIVLWNPESGERVATLDGHSHGVRRLAFSADGAILASASWDKTVRLWDVATHRLLRRIEGHDDFVFGVAFSPDDTWLATASWDGTLRMWSLPDGRELARFVSDESRIHSVAVAPDGGSIAYGGLKVHRLALGAPGDPAETLAKIVAATGLDPDELRLAGD